MLYTQLRNQLFLGIQILFTLCFAISCESSTDGATHDTDSTAGSTYYIDGAAGSDDNTGLVASSPWQTLAQVSGTTFQPGDSILFKRGSSYSGCVTFNGDGTAENPITISAYGTGDAPSFTNPDVDDSKGNAMRIRGDYQIVENLYFHHTAPAKDRVGFVEVWAVGALHISLGNDHVIIRNNEFAYNAKAIHSYSEYSLITENNIHDANPDQSGGFLSAPYWGPIGIHIGIGNQEISYNTISNMYVDGGEWGGDGGAIELDDGRNHKDNIHVHHNTTFHNMGFMEISWWEDIAKVPTENINIHHNVCRDYQGFVLWWAPTQNSAIANNTIIRTDNEFSGPFDGVFFFDAQPAIVTITKNIFVSDNDLTKMVYVEDFDGGVNDLIHENNCYWDIEDGEVDLHLELGPGEIIADPLFVDFEGGDYHLLPNSPAAGWGAME